MSSSEGDMNIQGRASEAVTLPFTTMQQTYNLGGRIDVICFTAKHGVKAVSYTHLDYGIFRIYIHVRHRSKVDLYSNLSALTSNFTPVFIEQLVVTDTDVYKRQY